MAPSGGGKCRGRLDRPRIARSGEEFGDLARAMLEPALRLDEELRYHLAEDNHAFVAQLLEGAPAASLRPLAESLERQGYHLRLTRDLAEASTTFVRATRRIRQRDLGSLRHRRIGISHDSESTTISSRPSECTSDLGTRRATATTSGDRAGRFESA